MHRVTSVFVFRGAAPQLQHSAASMSIFIRRVLLSPVKQVAGLRLTLFANMSMKAVKIHEYGDSSKLSYEEAPIPDPGPHEV